MYEFSYYNVKPIYGKKAKLCYMNTNSFTVRMKADDIYKDIEEDVETSFETSYYLIDDGSEGKKARGTKNYVIQRKLKFQDNENCLQAIQLEKR